MYRGPETRKEHKQKKEALKKEAWRKYDSCDMIVEEAENSGDKGFKWGTRHMVRKR